MIYCILLCGLCHLKCSLLLAKMELPVTECRDGLPPVPSAANGCLSIGCIAWGTLAARQNVLECCLKQTVAHLVPVSKFCY